jgi:hypothetical protein
MALVKVVSGFIELPNHPRGAADYKALGEGLLNAVKGYEALVFDSPDQSPGTTWLAQYLKGLPNITHSVADNPEKNTMAYHCVQYQKFRWLAAAKEQDTQDPAQMYVWIDYGILHVPGVTPNAIQKYLARVSDYGGAVTMPGCWPKGEVPHDRPCWRFCGGLMAVPSPLVKIFTRAAMAAAARQIMATRNVEWEVNTLARLEALDEIPMTWYKADHNETMFTGAP